MKTILTALSVFLILSTSAQVTFKSEWKSASAILVAGIFDGQAEIVKWHYSDFKAMFPNANDQFFDPEISWRNKHEGGLPENGPAYFGSTTFLVGTTDWYHMSRTFRNSFMLLSITLAQKHGNWKQWLLRIAIHSLAYHAGFWISFEIPAYFIKN
jgi:hypothetical protein